MPAACARVPVAQYLRVSTDHQRDSLDNQSDFIERYATAQEKSGGLEGVAARRDGGRGCLQSRMMGQERGLLSKP